MSFETFLFIVFGIKYAVEIGRFCYCAELYFYLFIIIIIGSDLQLNMAVQNNLTPATYSLFSPWLSHLSIAALGRYCSTTMCHYWDVGKIVSTTPLPTNDS